MENSPMNQAQIPNPALAQFSKLIGEWRTVGTHPYRANKVLYGYSSFKWIEGGAFLIGHSEIDEEGFPTGISIFGSDDAVGEFFMLYFDQRKVSRKYDVSVKDNIIKWWRDVPGFSQRCSWTFSDNDTIIGKGELCKDGTTWEGDMEQTYTRIK